MNCNTYRYNGITVARPFINLLSNVHNDAKISNIENKEVCEELPISAIS
jgi:hypothetical protein